MQVYYLKMKGCVQHFSLLVLFLIATDAGSVWINPTNGADEIPFSAIAQGSIAITTADVNLKEATDALITSPPSNIPQNEIRTHDVENRDSATTTLRPKKKVSKIVTGVNGNIVVNQNKNNETKSARASFILSVKPRKTNTSVFDKRKKGKSTMMLYAGKRGNETITKKTKNKTDNVADISIYVKQGRAEKTNGKAGNKRNNHKKSGRGLKKQKIQKRKNLEEKWKRNGSKVNSKGWQKRLPCRWTQSRYAAKKAMEKKYKYSQENKLRGMTPTKSRGRNNLRCHKRTKDTVRKSKRNGHVGKTEKLGSNYNNYYMKMHCSRAKKCANNKRQFCQYRKSMKRSN